jgi:uncharacterized protein DUF11
VSSSARAHWGSAARFLVIALALLLTVLVPGTSHADPCHGQPPTDLALTQSVSARYAGTFYELTVTNNGPSCARGVQIQDVLPAGSSFVGFIPVHPSSWSCSSEDVVICSLKGTIPPPPGSNSVGVIIVATPAAGMVGNEAVVGADVDDPDCPEIPPSFCSGDGANNEVWGAYGTSASTGTPNSSFITTSLRRPPHDPASIGIQEVTFTSPLAAPVPPPCDPDCLGDRQVVLTTDPTPEGELMTIVVAYPAPGLHTKPDQIAYRFDHEQGVWLTLTRCPSHHCDPEVGWVKYVILDEEEGVVYLSIVTSHNGHIAK